MESSPVHDAVIWTQDDQGERQSHWVRGSRAGMQLIATRPGLIMPWNQTVWMYHASVIDVPLCDCRAWEVLEFQGECPVAEEPGQRVRVTLEDLSTPKQVDLLPVEDFDEQDRARLGEISADTRPIASLGKYLFLLNREQGRTCEGVSRSWSDELLVVDLETQSFTSLLSDEELEQVEQVEQVAALDHMRSDLLGHIKAPGDLELFGVMPSFNGQSELTITYHFTALSSFEAEVGAPTSQSRYVQSIAVPAKSIPRALVPYGTVWPIVRAFAISVGSNDRIQIGGWFPIIGTPDELNALLRVFAGDDPDDTQEQPR
jgi:hypothetical protein